MLPPFFIVGCARSGTTLLRDLLRLHPNLNAPEETFFYRWGEPFGTTAFLQQYRQNPTIKNHRSLDGIEEDHFEAMLNNSVSRKDLSARYAVSHLKREAKGQRWFDKTPQNIYGLLLLHAQFPKSQVVHIHRHPLNVVASLKQGKVMPKQSLIAAINYWLEAVQIISAYRKLPENNLIELSYEDLTTKPSQTLADLFEHLEEDILSYDFTNVVTVDKSKGKLKPSQILIKPEQNKYHKVLDPEEIALVLELCGAYMKRFGYT